MLRNPRTKFKGRHDVVHLGREINCIGTNICTMLHYLIYIHVIGKFQFGKILEMSSQLPGMGGNRNMMLIIQSGETTVSTVFSTGSYANEALDYFPSFFWL